MLWLVVIVVVLGLSVAIAIDNWLHERRADGDYELELAQRLRDERRQRRLHLGMPTDDERRDV